MKRNIENYWDLSAFSNRPFPPFICPQGTKHVPHTSKWYKNGRPIFPFLVLSPPFSPFQETTGPEEVPGTYQGCEHELWEAAVISDLETALGGSSPAIPTGFSTSCLLVLTSRHSQLRQHGGNVSRNFSEAFCHLQPLRLKDGLGF